MHEASVGHQCPECVADGRRTVRQARTPFGGSLAGASGTVTKVLIGINLLIYLAAAATSVGGRGLLGAITPLHLQGSLIPGPTTFITQTQTGAVRVLLESSGVAGGEYYRILTSMFLHYGLIHLLFNMYALWVLGRALEAVLGPGRFLALYLLSGFGGGVAVVLFAAPHSLTAGASGAIFGLFSAWFVLLRRLGRDTSFLVPLLVINLVLSFVLPAVSLAGHLGGLITGAIVAAAIAFAPRKNRSRVQLAGLAGVLAVLLALTWYAMLALANVPAALVQV
jgi:membrane associated rhomboid family serine protease